MRNSVDRRALASLSLGHVGNDLSQGALPAVLVYLKPVLDLSYTMVAGVVLAGTVAISLVQPLFGHLHRRGALWLMPAGTVVGGVAMALAVISPTYALLVLLVGISGIGVGAFHPESARIVGHAGGKARATATSVYQVGGNVGFAIGPVIAAAAIGAWGLDGGLVLIAPGIAAAILLMAERGRYERLVADERSLGRRVATGARPPRLLAAPGGRRPAQRRVLRAVHVRSPLGGGQRRQRGGGDAGADPRARRRRCRHADRGPARGSTRPPCRCSSRAWPCRCR